MAHFNRAPTAQPLRSSKPNNLGQGWFIKPNEAVQRLEMKRGETAPTEKGKRDKLPLEGGTAAAWNGNRNTNNIVESLNDAASLPSGFGMNNNTTNVREAIGKFKNSPYYSSVISQQNYQKKLQQQQQQQQAYSSSGSSTRQHMEEISKIYQHATVQHQHNNRLTSGRQDNNNNSSSSNRQNNNNTANQFEFSTKMQQAYQQSVRLPQRPSTSNDGQSSIRRQNVMQSNAGGQTIAQRQQQQQQQVRHDQGFIKPMTPNPRIQSQQNTSNSSSNRGYQQQQIVFNSNNEEIRLNERPNTGEERGIGGGGFRFYENPSYAVNNNNSNNYMYSSNNSEHNYVQEQLAPLASYNRPTAASANRTKRRIPPANQQIQQVGIGSQKPKCELIQLGQLRKPASAALPKRQENYMNSSNSRPNKNEGNNSYEKEILRGWERSMPVEGGIILGGESSELSDSNTPKIIVTGNKQPQTHKIEFLDNSFTKANSPPQQQQGASASGTTGKQQKKRNEEQGVVGGGNNARGWKDKREEEEEKQQKKQKKQQELLNEEGKGYGYDGQEEEDEEEQRGCKEERQGEAEEQEGDDENDDDDDDGESNQREDYDDDGDNERNQRESQRRHDQQYAVPYDDDGDEEDDDEEEEEEEDEEEDEDGQEDNQNEEQEYYEQEQSGENQDGEEEEGQDEEDEEEDIDDDAIAAEMRKLRLRQQQQNNNNNMHNNGDGDNDDDDQFIKNDSENNSESDSNYQQQYQQFQQKQAAQEASKPKILMVPRANRPMTTEGGRRHRRARLPGDNDDEEEEEQKSDNFEYEDNDDRDYYATNTQQGDCDDNKRKRSEGGDGDDDDNNNHEEKDGGQDCEFLMDFDAQQFDQRVQQQRPPERGKRTNLIEGRGPVRVDHTIGNTAIPQTTPSHAGGGAIAVKRPPSRQRLPGRGAGLGIPTQDLQDIPIKNMYENGEQSTKEKNRSFFEHSKLKIEKINQLQDCEEAFIPFDFSKFGESQQNRKKSLANTPQGGNQESLDGFTSQGNTKKNMKNTTLEERPQSGNQKSRGLNSANPNKQQQQRATTTSYSTRNNRNSNHWGDESDQQHQQLVSSKEKENEQDYWDEFEIILPSEKQAQRSMIRRLEGSDIVIKHNVSAVNPNSSNTANNSQYQNAQASNHTSQPLKLPFETNLGQDFLSLFANN